MNTSKKSYAGEKSASPALRQIAIHHNGQTIYAPYALKETFVQQNYSVTDVKRTRTTKRRAD